MKRISRLLNDPDYRAYLARIDALETDRIFCKHNIAHFLDVARVALLLSLAQKPAQDKEIIYAAALTHDIGRFLEYEAGIPHEQAGEQLAGPLLEKAGFSDGERADIQTAIRLHRQAQPPGAALAGLLWEADRLSRPCMFCASKSQCHRGDKNEELKL